MPKIVKAAEAAEYYNVSISNLRKWAREGLIVANKGPGGQYDYVLPDGPKPDPRPPIRPNIIYCRVSSRKQESDLVRQSKCLRKLYPDYTVVKDIGSGINHNRPGFQTILEQLFKGNIKRVMVTHPDRFTRFGFDFFQWMFQQFGAVLETVEKPTASPADELVEDIMDVFTDFTTRYYGSRKCKSGDKESETDSDSETEGFGS
jgi:putative resolvase